MLRKCFLSLSIQRNASSLTYTRFQNSQTAIERIQQELKLKQLKAVQSQSHPEPKKRIKDEFKKNQNYISYSIQQKMPERTELLRIRGPGRTGYLVEVNANDLQMMTSELEEAIKGSIFSFDNRVIDQFKMKGVLLTEPMPKTDEQLKRAHVHGTVAGADEIREIKGKNQLQFTVPLANTIKAKKMLQNLGYKITSSAYKFQAIERVNLSPEDLELCVSFVKELEKIPHIVSVIHNM